MTPLPGGYRRTLEALRLIAKLMAQAKIRLDEAGELSVHGDGGSR
jgi:hypothetical protein